MFTDIVVLQILSIVVVPILIPIMNHFFKRSDVKRQQQTDSIKKDIRELKDEHSMLKTEIAELSENTRLDNVAFFKSHLRLLYDKAQETHESGNAPIAQIREGWHTAYERYTKNGGNGLSGSCMINQLLGAIGAEISRVVVL